MLDAYRDLIEELTGTPTALRRALDAAGTAPPEIAALIAELRDRDQAVHDRLQVMLRRRDPVLSPLPDPATSPDSDAEAALTGFNAIRGELVSLLMNLTLRDWERTAIDEDGEEVALAEEVEEHVDYDEDHRARIERGLSSG